MSDGYATLDRMIEAAHRLGKLPEEIAKAAAPLVQKALRQTAAAGTAPDGTAWAPKKDGSRPLVSAADAVEVRVVSKTVIQARLVGTSTGSQKAQAIQHYGTKKIPARPIIPRAGEDIPPAVIAAIKQASAETFVRLTGAT
jgi:hypothetical protein